MENGEWEVTDTPTHEDIPWSWESWRRIKGAEVVRLGGTAAREGAGEAEAEMTAEAGMCEISWSMLGLVGSSIRQNKKSEMLDDLIVIHKNNSRTNNQQSSVREPDKDFNTYKWHTRSVQNLLNTVITLVIPNNSENMV